MKDCFPKLRNARQTFVDQPEANETTGHQKSRTGLLQKFRRILPNLDFDPVLFVLRFILLVSTS
jgi:hypothetical protein